MKGKTVGCCRPCRMVYRWLRSFGPIMAMRCPTCKCPLTVCPWGISKIILEGYSMTDRRPEPIPAASGL